MARKKKKEFDPKDYPRTKVTKVIKPRKLKQEMIDDLCKLIEEGNFVKQACQRLGLSYDTYLKVMRDGKKGVYPYCAWRDQIEVSKARCETDIVSKLHDEIENGNVGVMQWMLARKFPDRWERTERIKAEVDNSQEIRIVRFSDKFKDKDKE